MQIACRTVWQALAPADRDLVTLGVQRLGEALRAVASERVGTEEPSRAS